MDSSGDSRGLGADPFKTPPTRPAATSSVDERLVLNRTSSMPNGHPSPERRKAVKRSRDCQDQVDAGSGSIDYPEDSAEDSESDHDEESEVSYHPRHPRKRRNRHQDDSTRVRRERAFTAMEMSRHLQFQANMHKFISDARCAFNEQIVMNYSIVREVQKYIDSSFQPPEGIAPVRRSKSQDLVARFKESGQNRTTCAVKHCSAKLSNRNYVVGKLIQNNEFRFYKSVCCFNCLNFRIDPSAQSPDFEGNIVTARDSPFGSVSCEARYRAGITIFATVIDHR